jgi:ATP/maltotriose-dependent transcriptional regulator MalT
VPHARPQPGARYSGPLVGRDGECAALVRALDVIGQGAPHAVEVTGDPGIGKTRLLDHLIGLAGEAGIGVLAGSAREAGRHVSHGPLIDALSCLLADIGPGQLMGIDSCHFGPLATIFPTLAEYASEQPGAAIPTDRVQVHVAVRALLERLASPGLVLVLDDMHWADEETADLLTFLLRRPPRAPVLLAFAYRKRQAPARLRAAVAEADLRYPVERLELGPLSEQEATRLLAGSGTSSWRHAVYEQSRGNPFYLEALAHSQGRCCSGRVPGSGGLPPSMEAALLRELDTLRATSRLAAQAAAVADEPFDPGLVADIAGLDRAQVLLAINEMAALDLVHSATTVRCFVFRHPLVRKVVYENSDPGWRISAHARAAQALKRRGASVTARAYHVGLTAAPGDLAAIELLVDAASEVRSHAPATAAQWLRAALSLLPAEGMKGRQTKLLFRLAEVLGSAGHLRECRDTLHHVLRLLPSDQPERRAWAAATCALMERHLCRRAEARALMLSEISALPSSDSMAVAELQFELACSELVDGDVPAASNWAEQALAVVRKHQARPLQAAVLGLMALARLFAADVPAAQAHLRTAALLLDGLLDSELTERLDAAVWVGWGEILLEQHDDALRHLDRALALARAAGHGLVLPHLLIGRVSVLRAAGRLAEASDCAEEALDLAMLIGSDELRACALAMRCRVSAADGNVEAARRAGTAALERRDRSISQWLTMFAVRMMAEVKLAAGDPDGCRAMVALGGGPDLPTADLASRVGWYELLTRAELMARRPDAASQWARRAADAAARLGLTGQDGLALLAAAQAQAAQDPATALKLAIAARDALAEAGLALDALRARLVAGRALAAVGSAEEAAAELKDVQAALEACGARPLAREALADRRRLAAWSPRRGRAAGGEGFAGLTRRETQIALLVADGLSNRLIAQRLHVTEKTVEMHLSHIFTKLAVSSRTAVAGIVIRAAAT